MHDTLVLILLNFATRSTHKLACVLENESYHDNTIKRQHDMISNVRYEASFVVQNLKQYFVL